MISNKDRNRSSYLIVLIPMLLIVLILAIVHLPAPISDNRPDLIVLIILFFSQNPKFKLNIEVAFVTGIVLDLVSGAPLGINAFLVCLQLYLITTQFSAFYKFSMWQQIVIIAVINLLSNVLGYWLEHIIGQSYYEVNFIIPTIATACFWPIVYAICSILCATFSVNMGDDQEKID